ncbi:MAG: hypothetical protein ACK4N5_14560 [Myxococcales bacterium]
MREVQKDFRRATLVVTAHFPAAWRFRRPLGRRGRAPGLRFGRAAPSAGYRRSRGERYSGHVRVSARSSR